MNLSNWLSNHHQCNRRKYQHTKIDYRTPPKKLRKHFDCYHNLYLYFNCNPLQSIRSYLHRLLATSHSNHLQQVYFKTSVFVMVLAWSRHQYAELVRDQSIETWLGCHRRSFENFNGVPSKIIIDNPKCAITKACYYDPQVQRAYADYAEGYGFLISPCPVADPKKRAVWNRGSNTSKTTLCRCVSSATSLTPMRN